MKKIILLLLLFLISSQSFSQIDVDGKEGFEGAVFPPTGWLVADNGIGTNQSWIETTTASEVNSGLKAAKVRFETIGPNETSEDWLITPLLSIGPSRQLRFFSKNQQPGDQKTIYRVMISGIGAAQNDLASYSEIARFTEEVDISNTYTEQTVNIGDFSGQSRHIAFVRVFTKFTGLVGGDSWILDDVKIVEQCFEPTELKVENVTALTATFSWNHIATNFEIEYGIYPFNPGLGQGTNVKPVSNPYTVNDLTPNTVNCYYVRALCDSGGISAWVGPYIFQTRPLGITCEEPIAINVLPYQILGSTTSTYGDDYDVAQGASCGATPVNTNYLAGDDAFYRYTPSKNERISITLTPLTNADTNSSVFVYAGCENIGVACIGGKADPFATPRVLLLDVTAGITYTVVVSSSAATQSISYDLLIQEEACTPKPYGLSATPGLTSAELNWTNPEFSNWEVAVQLLGGAIPSASGTPLANGGTVTTLLSGEPMVAATQYQYWVRAECSPGIFTAWSGPFVFNTLVCDVAQTCVHTFRMEDSANNGWNGALMQVKQNGIVIATIGSGFNTGSGPIDVNVALCKDLPFELFWSTAGTQPNQCIVSVLNSFGQTIYSKGAGAGSPGTILYSATVDCTTPRCDIPPTALTATPLATSAVLSWNAPSSDTWDIYVVPKGTTAPDINTTPTYSCVSANPFTTNSNLSPDSDYEFYVRVHCGCSGTPSNWSAVGAFHTLVTCPKPTNLTITGKTLTGATFSWLPAFPTDNKWEILLVPSNTSTLPEFLPPANPSFPGQKLYTVTAPPPFVVTDLDPATIYFYYVRTVCTPSENSVWSGPIVFNTTTCLAADKCVYRFSMTDTGGDGWNQGRMQVRQNGILVATMGSSISGAGPTNFNVSLCNGIPFDVYWSIAGDKPQEIGLSIQNPFGDIIYTKKPGEGTPLTVLYSDTGNCTAPSCPKPTNLTVANITANTVTIGWAEMGAATQWEYYLDSTGNTPPDKDAPVNVANVVNSNPFTVTGLTTATSYCFYVRAICSPTDKSTWTLSAPKCFVTTPFNDECLGAIVTPVNPTKIPTLKVSGNTLGGTATSLPNTCAGNANDDIWFSFEATSSIHIITFDNIIGNTTDLNHTVYSGADCSNLAQMYCSNPNVSIAQGLIVGNTYWIRVYTNGAIAGQSATFDLAITTPPVVTNDVCENAIVATANEGLVCDKIVHGSLAGATDSNQGGTSCFGFENDDVWYKFVATDVLHYFDLKNVVGSTSDLNHAVYKGDCSSLQLMFCSPSNSLSSNGTGFIIGQTYYVRVWSNSIESQDVEFDLCIGIKLPPIKVDVNKYTATELVEDVLFNTKCASVSNVKSSTGTNFGSVKGIGYFEKNGSDFEFKDGIILSTGNALSAPGPNGFVLSEGSANWLGDKDIENYLPPYNTSNASVLEFDFVPIADKISFNFLFASEEYGTFQCSYSDAFVFVLTNKNTGESKNIAVVPGTDIPVAVTTINDDKYNDGCPSANPELFDKYYLLDHPPYGYNPVGASINFNGITVRLTAQSDVEAGAPYHIKMAIADRADQAFDSAVFLEGGSFNIGSVDLGSDLVGPTAICPGQSVTLDSALDPTQYIISWLKDNVIIPGEIAPTLVVTEPGDYTVRAQYGASTCFAEDTVTVEYEPTVTNANDLFICSTGNVGVFNLKQNDAVILAPFPSGSTSTVRYFETQADADANTNAIATPTAYTNLSNPQTIFARVSNNINGCYQTISFDLALGNIPPQFTLSGATAYCPNDSTTITVVPVDGNYDPTKATYVWNFEGNVIDGETSSSLFISTSAGYGQYSVVVNNIGCESSQNFTIEEDFKTFGIEIVTGCEGNDYILEAKPIDNSFNPQKATYVWSGPDFSEVINEPSKIKLNSIGLYSVKVTAENGCSSIESIDVTDISCSIQKGISPNGDGKNDVFELNDVKKLEIYNRYGVKVYEKENYTNEWKGQSNSGQELPDGTYYYVIERNNGIVKTGWIYVQR